MGPSIGTDTNDKGRRMIGYSIRSGYNKQEAVSHHAIVIITSSLFLCMLTFWRSSLKSPRRVTSSIYTEILNSIASTSLRNLSSSCPGGLYKAPT